MHDYVRTYLGESRDAAEFAKQFIERRSHYKNKMRQNQHEVSSTQPEHRRKGGGEAGAKRKSQETNSTRRAAKADVQMTNRKSRGAVSSFQNCCSSTLI